MYKKLQPSAQQKAIDMMVFQSSADLNQALFLAQMGNDEEKAAAKAVLQEKVDKQLTGLEKQFQGAGPFVWADSPSVADIVIFALVHYHVNFTESKTWPPIDHVFLPSSSLFKK